MTCSVTEALRRNATRRIPVDEDVIKTMAERLEPPDKSSLWEKHSIVLDGEAEMLPQLLV